MFTRHQDWATERMAWRKLRVTWRFSFSFWNRARKILAPSAYQRVLRRVESDLRSFSAVSRTRVIFAQYLRVVRNLCMLHLVGSGDVQHFSIIRNLKMASIDPSRLISQLVRLLQDNPRNQDLLSCVANAINATVFSRGRDIKADLTDADKYLAFPTGTLEFSISPHARRPKRAELIGIRSRADA